METSELLASSASDPTGLLDRVRSATEGDFTIIREIGRGGMGRVLLAHEIALDRRVAMKVLPLALTDIPEIVERFKREARTAGKLTHPHIVSVYQVYSRDDLVFFTMPFISGPSLRGVLRQTPQLPIELARRYLSEAADALGYAHGRGVIHRDVKPENMLLEGSRDGRLLVTDFGIAKAMGGGTTLTRPGDVMGTPYYMSPEQCEERETLDGRSDQYSLGLLAYEMLSGRFPFTADSMAAIVYRHMHEYPEPLGQVRSDVPEDLRDVVQKSIQKDPDDRFPTMAELLEALGTPAVRPFVVKQPPAVKAKKAKPGRWIAAAMLVLAAASAGVFAWKASQAVPGSALQLAEIAVPAGQIEDRGLAGEPADTTAVAVPGTPSDGEDATRGAGDGSPGADPSAGRAESGRDEDGLAGQRERQMAVEVERVRGRAAEARASAVAAGADTIFPARFARLETELRAAQQNLDDGQFLRAVGGFSGVGGRFETLSSLTEQRRQTLLANADARVEAPPDTAAGGTRPEDDPQPVVAPEEAIGTLLEMYRLALEAEDTAALRRDVYKGEIPADDQDFLRQLFSRVQDLSVTVERRSLDISGDGAEAQIGQKMEFRLRTRERRRLTWSMVMRFERSDAGWRLVDLERR
ncbi:MAG: serine/threonine-protein kinase [Gemmatimonadota bacterium]